MTLFEKFIIVGWNSAVILIIAGLFSLLDPPIGSYSVIALGIIILSLTSPILYLILKEEDNKSGIELEEAFE